MGYILSTPTLIDSARLLGQSLGMDIITRMDSVNLPAPTIRWGNSDGRFGNDTFYNDPTAIYICGSKTRLTKFCMDNGISSIEYHIGTPERYPVVVRTLLHASEGLGIVLCENEEEFSKVERHPWSYYYNFSFELGVHILGGEIVRVFKKLRKEGLEEEKYPIRNSTRGYRFSLRSPEYIQENYPTLEQFVDTFYNAVNIQMARLDIGWDADTKIFRIIEANSAPGLTNNRNTLETYVRFLKNNLEIK